MLLNNLKFCLAQSIFICICYVQRTSVIFKPHNPQILKQVSLTILKLRFAIKNKKYINKFFPIDVSHHSHAIESTFLLVKLHPVELCR